MSRTHQLTWNLGKLLITKKKISEHLNILTATAHFLLQLSPQKLFSVVEGTPRVSVCLCEQKEIVEERKAQNSGFKSSLWQRQNEHRTCCSKQQRTPCTAADSQGSTLISVLPIFHATRTAAD